MITLTSAKKETKRERFVRLANKRTNEILDKLRILGGCANRRMYEYTESDVKKIFKAIDDVLKRIKALFETSSLQDVQLEV